MRLVLEAMLRAGGFELVTTEAAGGDEFAGVDAIVLSSETRAEVLELAREPGAPEDCGRGRSKMGRPRWGTPGAAGGAV